MKNLDDAQPQPGAVQGVLVPNGLPNQDICYPGWPTLPGSQAVNFSSAEPITISKGSTITRTYGPPTQEAGAYWLPPGSDPPETEAAFYGQEAVELSWNNGQFQATWQVPQDIRTWSGPTSRQPADDMGGNLLPGYYLPGGGPQVYIDPIFLGDWQSQPSPWDTSGEPEGRGVEAASADEPLPADDHEALLQQVAQLCKVLRRAAATAGDHGGAQAILAQADRLDRASMNARRLRANPSDPACSAGLGAEVRGLIHIGRYIHTHFSWSKALSAAATAALDKVVKLAYQLSAR
jgi:hypothetical protein